MADLIGLGELLIDFTPIKDQGKTFFKQNPGGAPCNMLAMAQSLGTSTAFIGKVGDDEFGYFLKQSLETVGVSTYGLRLSKDYRTTLAFVHLTDGGERSFSFYRRGCADVMLEIGDVDFKMIDAAKVIHFGSLSFTDEPSRSTLLKVLEYAKAQKKIITYDPNYRSALWDSPEDAIEGMKLGLKYANILKVSEEEAALITGLQSVEEAALVLIRMGIPLVFITLGEAGCYYCHANGASFVQAFSTHAVDTTGAGDAFFGTVVHAFLKSDKAIAALSALEIHDFIRKGNAAASLCIEGFGGIPSLPSPERVRKRLLEE